MKHSIPILLLASLSITACSNTENNKESVQQQFSEHTSNERKQPRPVSISTSEEAEDDDQQLSEAETKGISGLINLFKSNDIESISKHIHFPLMREYPLSPIRNAEEMKLRFNEVFDSELCARIAHSKLSQWSEVGWRGVMFNNGELWLWDAEAGSISAVNYQSPWEKNRLKELVRLDQLRIHTSIKSYIRPVYKIKTEHYLIRIDEISENEYRYASWKVEKDDSTEPDLILTKGKLEFEGSAGNHVITFTRGAHTYKIYRNILGEKDVRDITLVVERKGQELLNQEGDLILE